MEKIQEEGRSRKNLFFLPFLCGLYGTIWVVLLATHRHVVHQGLCFTCAPDLTNVMQHWMLWFSLVSWEEELPFLCVKIASFAWEVWKIVLRGPLFVWAVVVRRVRDADLVLHEVTKRIWEAALIKSVNNSLHGCSIRALGMVMQSTVLLQSWLSHTKGPYTPFFKMGVVQVQPLDFLQLLSFPLILELPELLRSHVITGYNHQFPSIWRHYYLLEKHLAIQFLCISLIWFSIHKRFSLEMFWIFFCMIFCGIYSIWDVIEE